MVGQKLSPLSYSTSSCHSTLGCLVGVDTVIVTFFRRMSPSEVPHGLSTTVAKAYNKIIKTVKTTPGMILAIRTRATLDEKYRLSSVSLRAHEWWQPCAKLEKCCTRESEVRPGYPSAGKRDSELRPSYLT